MEEENKKENVRLNNLLFKERFQFILQINDDIVCQRFFKINGLNYEALDSEEMKLVMDEVVQMIQNDLVSKSRVYDWFTLPSPIKLTGFGKHFDEYNDGEKRYILSNHEYDEVLKCENGEVISKTYMPYTDDGLDTFIDNDRPQENEFIFKFSFLFDDKVMYERIWDGNVYHKFVRNGVDLTNSNLSYKDKDQANLPFFLSIIKGMVEDKVDLIYHIIKKICYTLSSSYTDDDNEYTKKMNYGDKTYYCSTYNRDYVNGWRIATENKTKNYFNNLYPSEKKIEYIEKYL